MSEPDPRDLPMPARIDRRLAIKWILAAGAGALLADPLSLSASSGPAATPGAGYGKDPNLTHPNRPGDCWPLSFTGAERRDAVALCDIIIPADALSPSASDVGVPDFIDEWISAPYPTQVSDRGIIMGGLAWLDAASKRRFGSGFAGATAAQRLSLCDEIAPEAPAGSELELGSRFFKRFRNLASAGFYTTPVGMKDLGYVGNVPLARFDGPPAALVERLGLADEVTW